MDRNIITDCKKENKMKKIRYHICTHCAASMKRHNNGQSAGSGAVDPKEMLNVCNIICSTHAASCNRQIISYLFCIVQEIKESAY